MTLFDILPWWSWLFATLGLGGVILLAIFAPAAAAVAEQTVAGAIGRMLQTRIGVAVIVGAIALFVGHVGGGLYVESKCADRLEAQREAGRTAGEKRDATIGTSIKRTYTPVLRSLDDQAQSFQQWVAGYERNRLAEMAKDPVAARRCQLGDDALQLRRRYEKTRGAAAGRS